MGIRILHLCSEKGWRGGEQQVIYLVGELQKQGVENTLAVRKNSALERVCVDQKIPFFVIPFSNSMDFISALQVRSFCRENKVDIMHAHTSVAHGVAVLSAFFGNPIPILLSRRVDFVPQNTFLTKWKYNHPQIKFIAGVSDKIQQTMRMYVKHPEKCITIHSGIDISLNPDRTTSSISLRQEFNVLPSKIIVGNTSALTKEKDYFTFIDTIEKLNGLRIPAVGFIVGEGPLKAQLKDYVLRRGLQHLLFFTGFRKNIGEILNQFNYFLMPSKKEGLGTSLLDAFKAGVPVVATGVGGIPEVIIDNETGLLAPVGDSTALASAIKYLVEHEDERKRITMNAREYLNKFSKAETARKTIETYQLMLNG